MPNLPTGTVTFLFTDIEGSTARWERDPQATAVAVKRQIALIVSAIHAHGSLHDEGLPIRSAGGCLVERLGGVPPRCQETPAALAVLISPK
jgi:class 3 adenylate cyclase